MASPVTHAIIGTAGHIDHGKTALIKALTGQDTDRLKEEKERGISIDLGFAYFTLPDGSRAGIVDVPGHERFIRNMLAGAHGIDLVLFTVAADDGVMPQTEEHLDILHLLGTRRGIFVITKADLVDAPRLDDVRDEIELLADGTTLAGAPIIEVSSTTGLGLEKLRAEMVRQLDGFQAAAPPGSSGFHSIARSSSRDMASSSPEPRWAPRSGSGISCACCRRETRSACARSRCIRIPSRAPAYASASR